MSAPDDPLMRSVMRLPGTAPHGPSCPDADVLALYADQELERDERRAVEAHVAACGRCQQAVAAFVRSAPEPTPSADGLVQVSSWWTGWRWLVPVAASAGVVLLALRVGQGPSNEVDLAARQSTAPVVDSVSPAPSTPAPGEAASVAQDAQLNRAPQFEPQRQLADRRRADEPLAKERAAVAEEKAKADASRPTAAATPPAVGAVAAPAGSFTTNPAPAAPNSPPSAAPPPALQESATPSGQSADAAIEGRSRRQQAADTASKPAAQTPKQVAVDAKREESRDQDMLVANDVRSNVAERSLAAGWRLRGGRVERSTDQGRTWRRVPVPTRDPLRAVSATDAMGATVTTATGATFATSDGGRTWRPAVQ